MATENNKVGEEERAKELNLSYLHWLFPCSSPYWVSQSLFSWPPLTWQGPSFFLRRVCRVVNETQGEFMSYVLEECVCICVYMTCWWGGSLYDLHMGGGSVGQNHVWRHHSPWSGSELMLCKEIRERLVAQCGLGQMDKEDEGHWLAVDREWAKRQRRPKKKLLISK